MHSLNVMDNRPSIPSFLVNSLPKGGTNLLSKAVSLFSEVYCSNTHIGKKNFTQVDQGIIPKTESVLIGVDWPCRVYLSSVRQILSKLRNGSYATIHIPFSEDLATLLIRISMKSFLILRDPRDVVISHANYVSTNPKHFLFKIYQPLSESERIMASITGVKPIAQGHPMLLGIHERCQSVLPWVSQSFNYTTYFEKLVGSEGGGTRDTQIEELLGIAQHLNIKASMPKLEQIADHLFGGTHTFRQGSIGRWKECFSADHKSVFKDLAGKTLIELGYEENVEW